MGRFSFLAFVLFVCLFFVWLPSRGQASIAFNGDVEAGSPPASSDPNTWDSSTQGYIGYSADGSITVNDSSDLYSRDGRIAYGSDTTGIVTVDGDDSSWINDSRLYAGVSGAGILNVSHGGAVRSEGSFLGYNSGSTGFVTVDGAGSTWSDKQGVDIGYYGSGRLDITNGGAINVAWNRCIGHWSGSTGVVNVDGAGSQWTRTPGHLTYLYVGMYGNGWLNVTNGGTVENYQTYIGLAPGSTGVVTVDGVGSKCSNTYLKICDYADATGTLNIMGGGEVSVSQSVQIKGSQSLLAIDVGNGSKLKTGSITNNGTVRFLAGAKPLSGEVVSPISNEFFIWYGEGAYQAVGGTWYAPNARFTVSAVQPGSSGEELSIRSDQVQRVLIDDHEGTGWTLGASFLAETVPTTLTFTATAMGADMLAGLTEQMGTGHSVLGAWNFTNTSGYTTGDPVYLSFGTSMGYDRDDLCAWLYNGTSWSPYDASDLTSDGQYASFTVDSFSGYAISARSVLVSGDVNGDGKVDGSDVTILAGNWQVGVDDGKTATRAMGDLNEDGRVDGSDVTILAGNWQYGVTPATSVVPEPSVVVMVLIALLTIGGWRTWRKHG